MRLQRTACGVLNRQHTRHTTKMRAVQRLVTTLFRSQDVSLVPQGMAAQVRMARALSETGATVGDGSLRRAWGREILYCGTSSAPGSV
jgi:hypothetical protein